MFGAGVLLAATQVLVTVLDPGTGLRLIGLGVDDFSAAGQVESVSVGDQPVAAVLLVDSSVAGEVVRETAEKLINQLSAGDQMALMTFNRNASLAQRFTTKAERVQAALAGVRYENDPRVLDGLAAALEIAFPAAGYRKAIVLLTAGIEGPSRTQESAVIRTAREKGIAIYPLYLHGSGRWVFAAMALETGGAPFWLRETRSVEGIWETIRRPYLLTLRGPWSGIKAKGRGKTLVSSLPLLR